MKGSKHRRDTGRCGGIESWEMFERTGHSRRDFGGEIYARRYFEGETMWPERDRRLFASDHHGWVR